MRTAVRTEALSGPCDSSFRTQDALNTGVDCRDNRQGLLVCKSRINQTRRPVLLRLASSERRNAATLRQSGFKSMKYCYECGRLTPGEPLFCNFCGRSYDVKLCPRLHVTPRGTRAWSKCESRELSTPQPRVPFWATLLLFLLTLVPRLVLSVSLSTS